MRLRRRQNDEAPPPFLIDIQPDTIFDRQWTDEDGHLWRVGKPGWSYVIRRRGSPMLYDVGEGVDYESVRQQAENAIKWGPST
jgi:hypothetical protein